MRNLSVSILVLLLILTGCSTHREQYRIGVSQCLDDAWRQKMNDEMDRELLLYPEMALTRRIAYGDNATQCAQIDSFIREKVDLLVVSPYEADAVQPAVTRAYRAGIPVIVADRRVPGEEWTAFIGGDNYRVGQLMAEWVLSIQQMQRKPLSVLEVTSLPGSPSESMRHQGMADRLQLVEAGAQHPQLASVPGYIDAYKGVYDYLFTHKDVDVIVAHNDLMAIEAAHAVRDSKGYGHGSVRIMGVDGIIVGLQAIVDGTIECTAIYPTRGDLVVQTAAQILKGEPYVRDTILETMMIDATSAYPILQQYMGRVHDLETLQLVRSESRREWERMQSNRTILIGAIVLIALLFLAALGFLIYSQRKIKKEIKREILPQLEEVQEAIHTNRRDEAFAERIKQIIEEHLTDPNLSVEYLAETMQMDRTQLFRRVKSITGKGPMEYIRERRLIRAGEQLRTTDKSVKQIAKELCFYNPGYFTKYYKEYFGYLPSSR